MKLRTLSCPADMVHIAFLFGTENGEPVDLVEVKPVRQTILNYVKYVKYDSSGLFIFNIFYDLPFYRKSGEDNCTVTNRIEANRLRGSVYYFFDEIRKKMSEFSKTSCFLKTLSFCGVS